MNKVRNKELDQWEQVISLPFPFMFANEEWEGSGIHAYGKRFKDTSEMETKICEMGQYISSFVLQMGHNQQRLSVLCWYLTGWDPFNAWALKEQLIFIVFLKKSGL